MNAIEDYFNHFWVAPSVGSAPQVPLDEGACPAFLEVDISGNRIEVPMVLSSHALFAKSQGYTKLVFNLVNGSDDMGRRTFHRKTINTILKQFSYAARGSMRMAHVITSKGLHYYGCRGMIFDGNYNPLLLATITVDFTASTEVLFSNPACKLSYKVFENAAEIVEKTIIKQAIPLYANNGVDIYCNGCYYGSSLPVKLSIESLDSMIVRPSVPTVSSVNMIDYNNTIVNCYETN